MTEPVSARAGKTAEVAAETEAAAPVEPPAREVVPTDTPCRHLRNKGMYVYTDTPLPGFDDLEEDNSIYWCLCTMKPFGPDDESVGGRACRDTGRPCYAAI